ncbi:hypothetical protein FB45DRAFT_1012974 [Roridomyces roridus]|uniref:Uncharacterized protein n=1 Tax=Roridomyces roridus TaxID=1738132 RepID=A0AAD7AYV7_9AGAR|nr:hypothetical protein FB45DRAFT_1012974 [Roridomyces roridus]
MFSAPGAWSFGERSRGVRKQEGLHERAIERFHQAWKWGMVRQKEVAPYSSAERYPLPTLSAESGCQVSLSVTDAADDTDTVAAAAAAAYVKLEACSSLFEDLGYLLASH